MPEVRVDRPARPPIWVERKRDLRPTTSWTAQASPLFDAGVDDHPQLAWRHGVLARMLRYLIREEITARPPESAERPRDKLLHGHQITPRNGLTSPRPQLVWLAQTGQVVTGLQVMERSSTRSKRRILLCIMP